FDHALLSQLAGLCARLSAHMQPLSLEFSRPESGQATEAAPCVSTRTFPNFPLQVFRCTACFPSPFWLLSALSDAGPFREVFRRRLKATVPEIFLADAD